MTPKRRRRRVCSKQSNRDSRTVEAVRKPDVDQFYKATSVVERGGAEVMAATTTSAASVQSTKMGRSFEVTPLVKGISASQTSPGSGIVVKTLVLRSVAIQEGTVVTDRRRSFAGRCRSDFKLLAALVNPCCQFDEVRQGQLFNSLLNFLNLAHRIEQYPKARGFQSVFLRPEVPIRLWSQAELSAGRKTIFADDTCPASGR